jgi:5-methyltetrahydropteroyltriglutamate--homocysteine methyltransferase
MIESSRSNNAILLAFQKIGYTKGLGPGTYDIHSPVVPPVAFIIQKFKSFLECTPVKHLVVNPDYVLKTRTWPETIGAFMVEATRIVRAANGLP